MDNRPVQLERHPLRDMYVANRKVINTLLMVIIVFVGGEMIMTLFKHAQPGTFLSTTQVFLTIRLAAFVALFGLCQMIVICVGGGGLDLSVGYIATLAGILGARLMDGGNAGLPAAILTAIVIGAFFGLCNGLLTAYAGLPALVVTMAMANIVQGIVNAYVAATPIKGLTAPLLEKLAAQFTGVFPNICLLYTSRCV